MVVYGLSDSRDIKLDGVLEEVDKLEIGFRFMNRESRTEN